MKEKEKNRQVIKISVFITSIFVIFLSVTYAFINMTLVGTRRQVITAGNLELELLEDENNLTIKDAMPMYDEVGMIQDAFTFRLVNKTTTDTNYIIRLVDITTGERLDTSIVKYSLLKDDQRNTRYLSDLNDQEIDFGLITAEQVIHYSLRLWISDSVKDNHLIEGKSLSYKLELEYKQNIEIDYNNMMKARGIVEDYLGGGNWNYVPSKENYYQYSDQITNIVFENKISIPDYIDSEKIWDMSEKENRAVMAYLEEDGSLESGTVAYKLHIQSNGKVMANMNSCSLFYGFPNLISIDGFENLDISHVTLFLDYMNGYWFSIFGNCSKLNLDLTALDTSGLTSMKGMFANYSGGLLTIGDLDTSNVTDMSYMFYKYSSDQSLDLSTLNTSKVTTMSYAFSEYTGGKLIIRNWDTSNVTNMSHMFYGYSSDQSLDLSSFDTSNVTSMAYMFSRYSSNQPLDLSNFDTSRVTTMSDMFSIYSSNQPLNLSNFDTSNVIEMSGMFIYYSSNQPLHLSNFDTSNVIEMSGMFSNYSSNQSLDLSNFDTSSVTNMSRMFSNYSSNQPLHLSNFDTSNVIEMSGMFSNYSSNQLLDLSNLNTSKVTNMSNMFSGYSSSQPLDLSNFDTSKVTDMSHMFSNYSSNQLLDLSNLNTSNVIYMSYMFSGYSSSQPLDLSNFDMSSVTSVSSIITKCENLTTLDLSSFNLNHIQSIRSLFRTINIDCVIKVKNEEIKNWILSINNELINVTISTA